MKIWQCKIGEVDEKLVPKGGDAPMRDAVAEEYRALTGAEPMFIFSGWGAELEGIERAVVEDREPTEQECAESEHGIRTRLQRAEELLRAFSLTYPGTVEDANLHQEARDYFGESHD